MLRALYSSASGMEAQQMNLDVIANNLANVNTTGFKKSKVEFQDLLYQTKRMAGAEVGAGNQVPSSLQLGRRQKPFGIVLYGLARPDGGRGYLIFQVLNFSQVLNFLNFDF